MPLTTLDIREPGLNVLPPGVERHVVNAGGLTGLQIFPEKFANQLNHLHLQHVFQLQVVAHSDLVL